MNPNCEANPKLTGASLSPQAVSGPFTGSDTGIWPAPLKAEGYSQTFYAATAHLASPPFHTCRNAQLTAFADWHRAAGSPKYILGGDMNTDPNYQLYPGGPFSDRGTTAYLTYFFDTEDSLSRNYNPSSLGTRIGYTLDNSEEPTASFPLHVPSAVSLDHIVSNFASPYSATQQACTRRDRIFNYDHKPTICGFNIARIR